MQGIRTGAPAPPVNIAGDISTFTFHPVSAGSICSYNTSEERIEMKCGSNSEVNGWVIWAVDAKGAMWSDVVGKTVKVRVRVNCNLPTSSVINAGLGVFQNRNINSLNNSTNRRAGMSWVLAEDGYYEATFTCALANFAIGSLNPGVNATFGLYAYARSTTEIGYIYDCQLYIIG